MTSMAGLPGKGATGSSRQVRDGVARATRVVAQAGFVYLRGMGNYRSARMLLVSALLPARRSGRAVESSAGTPYDEHRGSVALELGGPRTPILGRERT